MDLKINYQLTDEAGVNVSNRAQEFDSLLKDIKNINETLKSNWQGADADSYTKEITEQAQVMDKLQDSIEDIGNFLKQVAKAYYDAMGANKLN